MKKQIQDYIRVIKKILSENVTDTDWEEVAKGHLIKIEFYQHERFIHLIVMVLFALMEIISVSTILITNSLWALALALMIMVLLIPYVGHYYFLENSVQELYLIYDKILEKGKEQATRKT